MILQKGTGFSNVRKIGVEFNNAGNEFKDFEIRY